MVQQGLFDICLSQPGKYVGGGVLGFVSFLCLSERLMMYEDTPTPCLENFWGRKK